MDAARLDGGSREAASGAGRASRIYSRSAIVGRGRALPLLRRPLHDKDDKDDEVILNGSCPVGRIYRAREIQGEKQWLWFITGTSPSPKITRMPRPSKK